MSNHHPYESAYIVEYDDGSISLEPNQYIIESSLDSTILHTVVEGETLQNISYHYYRDSGLWYIIAQANLIFNPLDDSEIYPGKILKIPNYGSS